MNPSWRRNYLRYRSYFLNIVGRYKERADVKIYLEILLSLATITIFAIFALRPTLLTIAELIKEIESKEQTIATMDTKIENLSQAQTVYNQQRANVELLNSAVPTGPSPDGFVRQMEGLSAKHQVALRGLELDSVVVLGTQTSQNKSRKGDLEKLPGAAFTLPFQTSLFVPIEAYPSLSSFLEDIESLRRPAKIDRLVYTTSEQEGEEFLILSIEGRLPFFQEETK